MRIRQGFVSNSSSSSFIAIVVKYPIDLLTDDLVHKMDVHGYSVLSHSEDGWEDRTTMAIGEIMETNDYALSKAWNMSDILCIWLDISNKMGFDGENLVITGSRMT